MLPDIIEIGNAGRHNLTCMSRNGMLQMLHDTTPLPADYIVPPPLPPSVLPHVIISVAMKHLYREESLLRGTNAVAYVNSLLVYATVLAHYLRDPLDSPANHHPQLEELARRAEKEGRRVKNQGTPTGPEDLPDILVAYSTRDPSEPTMTPVNWSFAFFQRFVRNVFEQPGVTFPRVG